MRDATLGTHRLPDGTTVRLRLPQAKDVARLHELARDTRFERTPLEIRRILRFDPRTQAVLVATTWRDAQERVLGLAMADLLVGDAQVDAHARVFVLPEHGEPLETLLLSALRDRAAARVRHVA